jgi:phosphoglycolate phosphatase
MISNYKYILFDVDGVILSSVDYYIGLLRDVAETLGASKNISDDFYKKNMGVQLISWFTVIVPQENHPKIRDVFFEKNKDTTEGFQFPMITGAKEILLTIQKNKQKVCFISTKYREAMDLMIKNCHLESLLDFSIAGDEVQRFKPDPEGIHKALNHFNAKPDEAVFIGDSLHDLGAARNANIEFIGVLSGICEKSDWESENVYYVPTIKELIAS